VFLRVAALTSNGSAKTGENVDSVFMKLAEMIHEFKLQHYPSYLAELLGEDHPVATAVPKKQPASSTSCILA